MNDTEEIVQRLRKLVDGVISKNQVATFTRKVKHRGNNTILSWNVFPGNASLLKAVFEELCLALKEALEDINGEIIRYEGIRGEIWDRRYDQFVILEGCLHEVYWYDPEIFGYIRVLHEKDKLSKEKEWVSVDVDLVMDSAWFVD